MSKSIEYEIEQVKLLGEEIGYGNLMTLASALWRKKLKDKNVPVSGAFIPICIIEQNMEPYLKKETERYDLLIEKYIK